MGDTAIDPAMLHAWLAARSVARGLPAPVADHGGYRVDTNSEAEVKRWVFPDICPGLAELAREIEEPRHALKMCGSVDAFRKALPRRWRIHDPAYFMIATGAEQPERPIAPGYVVRTEYEGAVVAVRVSLENGEQVASGYAAETERAFVYDRIVTAPDHRRKGVGNAVMAALRGAKRNPEAPELLVATADGRALYLTMGWRTLSPYFTASIPED
jgi:GNAT superfamily N-acetyltransferase